MISTHTIQINTQGNTDVINLTGEIQDIISQTKSNDGSCLVSVIGSTASITTIEYEPGLKKDIRNILDKLIPDNSDYHHHDTWGDDNGHSHLRASIMGPSIIIPFVNKRLCLGTWQQIVIVDFDTRPRHREIIIQLNGE
ncbi:MAG: YjbQ family protein [Planctomycetes bacterium]|nr:YjbQ family protein [Planctomycetota bacterium]